MNFKKILASVAAAALAVSSMAVCSFAEETVLWEGTLDLGAATWDWNTNTVQISADKFDDVQEGDTIVITYETTAGGDAQLKLMDGAATVLTSPEGVDPTYGVVAITGTSFSFVVNADDAALLKANGMVIAGQYATVKSAVASPASTGGDDTDSESDEPNYDIPDRPAEDTSAATEATSAPEETTTEEEAAPEAGTFKGSHTMSDSSWWTQDQIVDFEAGLTDLTVLIGDLDPASVASIAFSSDTAFFVGYNGKDGTWHQNADPVTSLTLTDVLLVEDGDKAPALHIMISKGDGVEYTINWVVTTGDAPATTEDTSASEAAPEDTSETSVVVEPGPVETTSEETNAGNSEDGNQPTGIVLAVIPAAAAVAGVIVSRKRS